MDFRLSMYSCCSEKMHTFSKKFPIFCYFNGKDQDVIARCSINWNWYPARIIDIDFHNEFYLVHFHGWDDAYNEWLPPEDIHNNNIHNSSEWSDDWTDSFSEMNEDCHYYFYRINVILTLHMISNIYRTIQQIIDHLIDIYLILIIIMFVVIVMLTILIMT